MNSIQLIIQLDEAGKISVNGPLDNKVLCYGLLESAKEAIRDFKANTIIQPALKIVEKM